MAQDTDLELPLQRGMVSKTPLGRPRYETVPPYYKEGYAKALIPVLDAMIANRQDKEFLRGTLTSHTLQQKVYQAFAYVIDHLDNTDSRYNNLREDVLIKKTDKGVVLCFRSNADKYSHQAAVHNNVIANAFHVRDAVTVNWRACIEAWLESGKEELILDDGFALSEQDMSELKVLISLVDDSEITVKTLTNQHIHLIRIYHDH